MCSLSTNDFAKVCLCNLYFIRHADNKIVMSMRKCNRSDINSMADLEIFRKTVYGFMDVNCYILVNHDTNECIVFDPGAEADTLT